jgi:hypothetical protein
VLSFACTRSSKSTQTRSRTTSRDCGIDSRMTIKVRLSFPSIPMPASSSSPDTYTVSGWLEPLRSRLGNRQRPHRARSQERKELPPTRSSAIRDPFEEPKQLDAHQDRQTRSSYFLHFHRLLPTRCILNASSLLSSTPLSSPS